MTAGNPVGNRMKVILTSSRYKPCIGGIESSLYAIGQALVSRGEQPVIVCGDDSGIRGKRLSIHERMDGLQVYRYRNPGRWTNFLGLTPIAPYFAIRKVFLKVSKSERPSHIVARQPLMGLVASSLFPSAKLIYVAPSLSTKLHSSGLRKRHTNSLKRLIAWPLDGLARLENRWLQFLVVKKAHEIVTFSANMESQIREHYADVGNRVSVVPPGVDTSRFFPAKDQCRQREELGLESDRTYGVIVGRFVAAKGIDIAVRAFAELKDHKNVVLLLVGEGEEKKSLTTLVDLLGVKDQVVFAGESGNPEAFYRAADFYVMSSRYESFGHSIIEAMACGLPVIGFRRNVAKDIHVATDEIVEHGVSGFVSECDAGELASNIRRFILLSREQKMKLSRSARSSVLERYDWNRFTLEILPVESDTVT